MIFNVLLLGLPRKSETTETAERSIRTRLRPGIGPRLSSLCIVVLSCQLRAAGFVEISAEMGSLGYALHDTNSIAKATRSMTHVVCVVGTNEWYIAEDYGHLKQWLFDGTK